MHSPLDFMRQPEVPCSLPGLPADLVPALRDDLITQLLASDLFRRAVEHICLPAVTRKIVDAKLQIGDQIKTSVDQAEHRLRNLVHAQHDTPATQEQPSAFRDDPSLDRPEPAGQLDALAFSEADRSMGEARLHHRTLDGLRSSTRVAKAGFGPAGQTPTFGSDKTCTTANLAGKIAHWSTAARRLQLEPKSQDKTAKHATGGRVGAAVAEMMAERTPRAKLGLLKARGSQPLDPKSGAKAIVAAARERGVEKAPENIFHLDESVIRASNPKADVANNSRNFHKSLRAMQKLLTSPSKNSFKDRTPPISIRKIPRALNNSVGKDCRTVGPFTSRSLVSHLKAPVVCAAPMTNLYGCHVGRAEEKDGNSSLLDYTPA